MLCSHSQPCTPLTPSPSISLSLSLSLSFLSRSPSSLLLSFLPCVLCFTFAFMAPTPSPPLTLTLSFPPRMSHLCSCLQWHTLLPPLLARSRLHSQPCSRLALLRSPLPRVCIHHHPSCLVFMFTTPLVPCVHVHHPPSCLVLVFAFVFTVTTVPVFTFRFMIALMFASTTGPSCSG
jgi:hypothetical protein